MYRNPHVNNPLDLITHPWYIWGMSDTAQDTPSSVTFSNIKKDTRQKIDMIAAGVPVGEIAHQYGVTSPAISHIKRRHADEIRAAAEKIINKASSWIDTEIKLVDHADRLLCDDTITEYSPADDKRIDHGRKGKIEMLRAIGVLATHITSPVFNQFNIVAGAGQISPIIQALLGQVPRGTIAEDTDDSIPAEITEILQD